MGSCCCHNLDHSLGEMESGDECLREASECDRLAALANTRATRALLALAAFQWRKLADKAAAKAFLAIAAGSGTSELEDASQHKASSVN